MPVLPKPPLSLPERIAALRAEIDLLIDKAAADEAKLTPGVPQLVIRRMITRGSDCQCRSFLIHEELLRGGGRKQVPANGAVAQ